jgi:hypothetical protein
VITSWVWRIALSASREEANWNRDSNPMMPIRMTAEINAKKFALVNPVGKDFFSRLRGAGTSAV